MQKTSFATLSVLITSLCAQNVFAQASSDDELIADEIIVEGEKVIRTLRETPTSTAVISGEEAAKPKHQTVQDVIQSVPNVFSPDSPSLPSIRGVDGSGGLIGGTALTTGAQPRVPVIVDGVPRPLVIGATSSLVSPWDLSTIEVARGPQGTTTGRNALAGAIRVNTNDPVYEFEAAARGHFFDQDGTIGGAFLLNMPIVQNEIAVRIAGQVSDGTTFVEVTDPALSQADRNFVEDEKFRNVRGKLLITPEALPDLELLFTV